MPLSTDWHLENYRSLLRLLVRQFHLDPRLRRRFDSSELVQETLLRAYENRHQFDGPTEAELVKWLQRILANVVIDRIRHERAGKRDVALERSLDADMADSSQRLQEYLAPDQSTPLQQAERQELLMRIARALDRLPADQQHVVTQRDIFGARVSQIAEEMGRTEKAVAGLLLRGRRRLRELLHNFGQ
jgi:RNA polymerase sigma-70 factor (ECF subfamily)